MTRRKVPQTRTYIGEVISRAVKTVLVEATSKKEALQKLRGYEGYGVDVHYDIKGYRIVGIDGLKGGT